MEELQWGYYTLDITPAFWSTVIQDIPRLVGLCWDSQSTIPCLHVAITALSGQAQELLPSVLVKCHHFHSFRQVDITGRGSSDLPTAGSKNNKVSKNHRREPSRNRSGEELLILCEGQGMLTKIPHLGNDL